MTGVLTQDCAGAVARRDCGGGHPSGRCLRRRVQADLGRWLVRAVPLNNDSSSTQTIFLPALMLAATRAPYHLLQAECGCSVCADESLGIQVC